MVVAWLGLYFVIAKHTLAAHKIWPRNAMSITQNCIPTTYMYNVGCARRHVCYPMPHALHDASLSIIEVNAHQLRIPHSFLSSFYLWLSEGCY